MAQYMFGTGRLTSMPVGGGAPVPFGALQGVSIDFAGDLKELWGRNQYPLDVARGKIKITGKASNASIDTVLYNNIFFGQSIQTAQEWDTVDNESHVIPGTPFHVVTTVGGALTLFDLGVVNAATGVPLTFVSGVPTTGQYSTLVTGGLIQYYIFAAADAGVTVLITYVWAKIGGATTGALVPINQLLMGSVPTFQLVANGLYKTKSITMTLYSCVSSKMSLPFKQDDYTMTDFDFSAYDNGTGAIGTITATNT